MPPAAEDANTDSELVYAPSTSAGNARAVQLQLNFGGVASAAVPRAPIAASVSASAQGSPAAPVAAASAPAPTATDAAAEVIRLRAAVSDLGRSLEAARRSAAEHAAEAESFKNMAQAAQTTLQQEREARHADQLAVRESRINTARALAVVMRDIVVRDSLNERRSREERLARIGRPGFARAAPTAQGVIEVWEEG